LNAIISDFQVNENGGHNDAPQSCPSIAIIDNGSFILTWRDNRNGYDESDIYAQRYSSDGNSLGPNFRVNDDLGLAHQGSPSIAADSIGNFVITWVDDRDGDYDKDIYAQLYSNDGVAFGANFKVNDDQGSKWQRSPSISSDGTGNFVITWEDGRSGYSDIYAQRYSSDGIAIETNFKVNDDQGYESQSSPSISIDNSGNFVITWQDFRNKNDDSDIYVQRYSNDGIALGTNFKVNDVQGTGSFVFPPSISSDGIGNFVIAWDDGRNGYPSGYSDIYAQRYSHDGVATGSNFQVNNDQGIASQSSPSISSDGTGNFVITWVDERNGYWDLYAQRYSSDGITIGSNFKVNNDQGSVWQRLSISMNSIGNFVITWSDSRNSEDDIYVQRYSIDGNVLGSNFKVNDDLGFASQSNSSISVDSSGNFVITWQDDRNKNDDGDIYAQRYSAAGSMLETNFKVNDDQGNAWQALPAISGDGSGAFVITWSDWRHDGNGSIGSDIYAQRFSSDGTAINANFKVNNGQESVHNNQPSIDIDLNGNFVITWWGYYDIHPYIYAQRFSSDGAAIGSNFTVNDESLGSLDPWGSAGPSPSIVFDIDGNFICTWSDTMGIYAQRFTSDGIPISTNFRVNDEQWNEDYRYPSIAIDGSGIFVITWNEFHNVDSDIYAQRYSRDGISLGPKFSVIDDQENFEHNFPSISSDDNGNFVIVWEDNRNGNLDIFAQLYSSDSIAIGRNFRVTNTSEKAQTNPRVKLWNGRIYNTWTDNRDYKNRNSIWANVLDWEDLTGISENELQPLPSTYILFQNYPNPFNPTTAISYKLPAFSQVELNIYNILGQKVAALVNAKQNAGMHTVQWNAAGFASGIYFYRLETENGFVQSRKLIFLK
jgi:hypothetical protein